MNLLMYMICLMMTPIMMHCLTMCIPQLRAQGITEGIVADLGCGTGELTLRLAEAGYDMIGVDLSSEMLCVVREKAAEAKIENLLLLNQDITQLDLFGTVRGVVSTF